MKRSKLNFILDIAGFAGFVFLTTLISRKMNVWVNCEKCMDSPSMMSAKSLQSIRICIEALARSGYNSERPEDKAYEIVPKPAFLQEL